MVHAREHDIHGAVPAPVTAPDAEVIVGLDHQEKGTIEIVEDVKDTFEDPNSPEAILNRYPLLRNKSQQELDLLNHKVRRIMCVFFPFLTKF